MSRMTIFRLKRLPISLHRTHIRFCTEFSILRCKEEKAGQTLCCSTKPHVCSHWMCRMAPRFLFQLMMRPTTDEKLTTGYPKKFHLPKQRRLRRDSTISHFVPSRSTSVGTPTPEN